MYVIYAAICGCIPVIYPIEGLTKEEYMKNRIYNCGGKLINIGFAYGNKDSEINKSLKINKYILNNINKIFEYYSNTIGNMCNDIYNDLFNNIKLNNTIINYYINKN